MMRIVVNNGPSERTAVEQRGVRRVSKNKSERFRTLVNPIFQYRNYDRLSCDAGRKNERAVGRHKVRAGGGAAAHGVKIHRGSVIKWAGQPNLEEGIGASRPLLDGDAGREHSWQCDVEGDLGRIVG